MLWEAARKASTVNSVSTPALSLVFFFINPIPAFSTWDAGPRIIGLGTVLSWDPLAAVPWLASWQVDTQAFVSPALFFSFMLDMPLLLSLLMVSARTKISRKRNAKLPCYQVMRNNLVD